MATFRQLEALVTVVDQGTFLAASKRLGVAQSGISRQIQELESWIGYPLIERGSRAARPTLAATEVLSLARKILIQKQNLEGVLYSEKVIKRKLRIGVTELTALTWLPSLVSAIHTKFPKVQIEPIVDQSTRLVRLLSSGRLDVVVVPDVYSVAGMIKSQLGKVEVRWYVSPKAHEIRFTLDPKSLNPYLLLSSPGGLEEGLVDGVAYPAESSGMKLPLQSSSLVASLGLALSALANAYLPKAVADPFVRNNRLVPLEPDRAPASISYVVMARSDGFGNFHRTIFELAKKECDLNAFPLGGSE